MLTAEDRQARRGWLGSSDLPKLAGEDPFGSALSVFLFKVYDIDEPEDTGEPIELGNEYEVPNLRWAARELGVEIELDIRTVGANPLFRSTHDALILDRFDPVTGRGEGMEAKVRLEFKDGEFGEPGTDQVPARVILQCQHQCYTGNLQRVWVPVMLPFRGRLARRLYKVERSEVLIAAILEIGVRFWTEHVLPKIPPPAVFGEVEIFKRIVREVGRVATVPAELVETWETAKRAAKQAETVRDVAYANVLAAVGDAEAWEWGDPEGRWYSYYAYPQTRADREGVEAMIALVSGLAGCLADPEQSVAVEESALACFKTTSSRKPFARKPEKKGRRR